MVQTQWTKRNSFQNFFSRWAQWSHPVVKSQWALWLLSSPLDFFGNFFSVKNSRFLRNLSETGDAVRRTRRTDPKPKQRPPPPKKSRKLPKDHSFDLRPVAVMPRSWQQAINKLHDLLLGVYKKWSANLTNIASSCRITKSFFPSIAVAKNLCSGYKDDLADC